MADYSNHKYSSLLTYLQSGCERNREKNDFSQYLIPMEEASSVEALVVMYNNYYFMLAFFILYAEKMPPNWYKTCLLGLGNAGLFRELSDYFNDNVVRLFKDIPNPTIEQRQFFLANMRYSEGVEKFHDEIVADTDENERGTFREILFARKYQYEHRMLMEKSYSIKEVNRKGYKNCTRILLKYHRICDIAELRFGREFGFEYNYDVLQAEFQAEQEKLLERKKQEEIQKKQQDSANLSLDSGLPDFVGDVGDMMLSAALALPFGIIGGIMGAALKGKGRKL